MIPWCTRRLAAAFGVAAVGIAGGIAIGHRGLDGYGGARVVSPQQPGSVVVQPPLAEWLVDIRKQLGIRPDQQAAWQNYADALNGLDGSRLEFERRAASGAEQNTLAERARHALILAAAFNELQDHLSPEQQARARPLTLLLAASIVCRELATH